MSRFLFIIFLLCSCCTCLLAQESYRAIMAQGRAYLTTSRGFHQVIPGELLSDTAKIQMVDNALLTLMDTKGRLLTLDNAGKFDLATVDLSQNPDSSQLVYDLWTTYFEKNVLTSLDEQNGADDIGLEIFLPSSSQTSLNQITLIWTDTGASEYEVQLLDEFEEIFHVLKSNRPMLLLNLLSTELVWKRQVFLRVVDVSNNQSSGMYALRKLSPPDADRAKAMLKGLAEDQNLISILTLTLFYEEMRWLSDVHSLLLMRARENEMIRGFYFDFLDRNGFSNLKRQFHR